MVDTGVSKEFHNQNYCNVCLNVETKYHLRRIASTKEILTNKTRINTFIEIIFEFDQTNLIQHYVDRDIGIL